MKTTTKVIVGTLMLVLIGSGSWVIASLSDTDNRSINYVTQTTTSNIPDETTTSSIIEETTTVLNGEEITTTTVVQNTNPVVNTTRTTVRTTQNNNVQPQTTKPTTTTTTTTTRRTTTTVVTTTNNARYELAKQLVNTNMSEYNEVLELTNQLRKENGLKPLTLDRNLCIAASIRAIEITEKLEHNRPGNKKPSTVLNELGIDWRAFGENLAYSSYRTNALWVYTQWEQSIPHKENMIDEGFNKLGVGKYMVGNKTYWIQIFTN